MIIGVTGSIGSGKSTISKIFGKNGFKVISADEISHSITKKNQIGYKKIIQNFGTKILDKNKGIDRKKLGDIVFGSKSELKKINSILHPIIDSEIKSRITKSKNKDIVLDIPLLLETDAKNLVDKVVVVNSSRKNILKRIGKKFTEKKIESILNNQMPFSEKKKFADFIVVNDADEKNLEPQIKKIIKKIK